VTEAFRGGGAVCAFAPAAGLGHGQPHPEREAIQARADAVSGPPGPEKVYEHATRKKSSALRILPPACRRGTACGAAPAPESGRQFPEAKPHTPPAPSGGRQALCCLSRRQGSHPKGIVETIRAAATTLVRKSSG